MNRVVAVLGIMVMFVGVSNPCAHAQVLQGKVEQLNLEATYGKKKLQPEVPGTDSQPLQGSAEEDALQGQQAASGWQGEPGVSDLDKEIGMLKGTAKRQGSNLEQEDPDAEDQELMIAWDHWRNRFLRAVQLGMMEILNNQPETNYRWDPQRRVMTSRIPLGTEVYFSCQITPNLKVQNLKILHPSGYPEFDNAVLEAIRSLEDTKILKYPDNSKRHIVTQAAGIRTADNANYQYQHFGDVERQIVPGP